MPKKRSRGAEPRVRVRSITPFLWFKDQAEPAAKYYVSLFQDAKTENVRRYGSPGRGRGLVMSVELTLGGRSWILFNGGPYLKLSPAVSLFVECPTQKEVDFLWKQLTRGGSESQCGWLVDRFGLSWQIIPDRLIELLGDPDPERAGRAMQAMLKMKKIEVSKLESAVGK